jgi:spermidine/putrescine transport system permease protein
VTARRFDYRHTPGLGAFVAGVFAFLYAPLGVLIAYAFNANQVATVWSGFSLRWFGVVIGNADIQRAAWNSLAVAAGATLLATAAATAGALGLERGRRVAGGGATLALVMLPLVVPEIVTAITSLVFFSAIRLHAGLGNLVIAHTVFCIPFALLPIRARLQDMGLAVEEAARDLYASEWRAFRRVTLPLLLPAIVAGALLAFVVSLDDFLISLMVSEAGTTTLPVYIYGMLRLGITPQVNALSALLLVASLALVAAAILATRRPALRAAAA